MNAKSASRTKIRCAEVGLGHLAQVAITPAFAHAENSELAALVTSDPTKQKELSKKRNERLATFTCSFGAAAIGWYTLIGTKGLRSTNPAYEYSKAVKLSAVDEKTAERKFPKGGSVRSGNSSIFPTA